LGKLIEETGEAVDRGISVKLLHNNNLGVHIDVYSP
jgi:hypothetical protein